MTEYSSLFCPCQSGRNYDLCCEPYHLHQKNPATAQALMRARYCAYVLQKIDYIVATTLPSQQHLLDVVAITKWSSETKWLGLEVLRHIPNVTKHHAQVEFVARFEEKGNVFEHHELSAFVRVGGCWYFIDPTVALPTMKQACICGSAKKFKACCGQFFR